MDVIKATQYYIDRVVSDAKIDGMKALLLDNDTKNVISMVYT